MEKHQAAQAFSDSSAVAKYADGPRRMVPGFVDLQRMSQLLLAESVGDDGSVLVVGAGGGLELKVFAEAKPSWTFEGVDPSREMIALAKNTLGDFQSRVSFVKGYIEDASSGPFDGATCLLTLHFLKKDERLQTLKEIRRRLKPGAPFISAHHSVPKGNGELELWLSRFASFAISSGIDQEKALSAAKGLAAQLPILSPEEDRELLEKAGFQSVSLFYSAFTFRGWVAYA